MINVSNSLSTKFLERSKRNKIELQTDFERI